MGDKRPEGMCKDCWTERSGLDFAERVAFDQLKPRPTPHPGPRCATHHRAVKRARKASAHEARVQKVYGLGPGEYDRLYAFQQGVCSICRRATGATRRLSVDHDHATGEVRGLICRPCNDMLGHARDDSAMFVRAAAYLKWPPIRAMRDRETDGADGVDGRAGDAV